VKITAEPRSDQWNADDFVGGPRTFTIAGVKVGAAEQKYDIELVEGQNRAWRPPLTVLRLLVAAWGDEAADWVGRRVTLYRDDSIRFGRDVLGGIRVSHLSDLPDGKTFSVLLTVSRGKRATFTVDPLVEDPSIALNAAKKRVAAAAPEGVDLRTWVPEQLKDEPGGVTTANLIALAEKLEGQK
jgi:hypothetical protein